MLKTDKNAMAIANMILKYSTGVLKTIGLLVMAGKSHANAAPERPYMVGPDLYEIHTDAKFFVTNVFVNGQKVKLSNAEGNGRVRTESYSVSGPIGYPNKAYLNAYLSPGRNEVKVMFESPLAEEIRGSDGEEEFIRDMYAHVVINSGQLTKGDGGTESYYLDHYIADPGKTAKIERDALLRRFTADLLAEEVSVVHTITVSEKDAVRARAEDCDLEFTEFSGFTGTVSINGEPIYEVENFGSAQRLADLKAQLRPGENVFRVDVKSLRDGEATFTALQMNCDMSNAIKALNFPEAYSGISFGNFFNKVYLPLVRIDIPALGTYSASFSHDF